MKILNFISLDPKERKNLLTSLEQLLLEVHQQTIHGI